MRVLHFLPSLCAWTGGPARSVPALCEALCNAGIGTKLVTSLKKGTEPSVNVDELSYPVKIFNSVPWTQELPGPRFYWQFRKELQCFDLVHLHSLWNPGVSLAALACRHANVPYIVSPLGMLRDSALSRRQILKRAYHRLIEQHTINRAKALRALTEVEASEIKKNCRGVNSVVVVPNGVVVQPASRRFPGSFQNSYAKARGRRMVLFLGRLHWSKRLELQLQALNLVLGKREDVLWVLVGPDAGEWANLAPQIESMGLDRSVLWTGLLPHDRCLQALADAEVCLLTSRHEGHSMAMNEAMSVGVPLVATEEVGYGDIRDCGAGFVVAAKPECVAQAILDILADNSLALKMTAAGRRYAEEKLAWHRMAMVLKAEYKKYSCIRQIGNGI